MRPEITPDQASEIFQQVEAGLRFRDLFPLAGVPGLAADWPLPPGRRHAVAGLVPLGAGLVPFAGYVEEGEDVDAAIRALAAAARRPDPRAGESLPVMAVMAFCPVQTGDPDLTDDLTARLGGLIPPALLPEDAVLALRAAHRERLLAGIARSSLPDHLADALRVIVELDLPPTQCLMRLAREDRAAADLRAFARSHPLLAAHCYAKPGFFDGLDGGWGVRATVKAALPGIDDARLRRLAGVSSDAFAELPPRNPHGIGYVAASLRVFPMVPVDWTPAREDWADFATIAAFVDGLTDLGLDPATLLAASKGRWRETRRRFDGRWFARHARHEHYFNDPPSALMYEVLLPLFAHAASAVGHADGAIHMVLDLSRTRGHIHRAAARLLYGRKSLKALLEASETWHQQQWRISSQVGSAGQKDTWPALFEPLRLNGLDIVPVADGLALLEEGQAGRDRNGVPGLDHCVATRRPLLMRGEAHVVSVRRPLGDGGYERLSTAQISIAKDPGQWTIRVDEHRGRENQEPPVEARDAVDMLIDGICADEIALDQDATEHRPYIGDGDPVARDCGYDWRDPERIASALTAWDPLLPRWIRGLDPARVLDRMEAEGMIDPALEPLRSRSVPLSLLLAGDDPDDFTPF